MAHGDFYFTINATFYHFTENFGGQALIDYWKALGREYLAPLARQFQQGGPVEIARYWTAYFAGEPGAQVEVTQPDADTVRIDVQVCPAIRWLRESPDAATHPPAHPLFCEHCRVINGAMMSGHGYDFELEGGGGSCLQTFRKVE